MAKNPLIPGQLNDCQLNAIEAVASLVPNGGSIVEVGSLFGLSSWTWAKNVHPSVTVYCIDPWEGNEGVRSLEERYGVKYGLEQFRVYTADCPNIVPMQGYSPRDFLDWDEKIHLYYEDAVHTDPILSENLTFWTSHLAKDGIICGDDYRPRFPDVRRGAERLAEHFGRELLTVENFWCLLPASGKDSATEQVRARLIELSERYRAETIALGIQNRILVHSANADRAGKELHVDLSVEQQGLIAWPTAAAAGPLELEVLLCDDPICENVTAKAETTLETFQLQPDLQVSALVTFPYCGSAENLWLQATVKTDGARLALRPIGIRPRIDTSESVHRASISTAETSKLRALRSREYFLRHSRDPSSFGVKPTSYSYYELDRPGMAPITIRSMLSTHEMGLLYALARDHSEAGAIVDLGPLMGASTWAFARGLAETGQGAPGIIHSFDLWRTDGTYESYLKDFVRGGGGSILGAWMQAVSPWAELCIPHQGNFLDWHWDGRDIGILFVDIAKSWPLNNHVVSTMFPCLRPGSVLVQQDYIHWNEYWVHIEMARFRPYFEHCQFLRGATSYYLCTQTPPRELCRSPANTLTYSAQVDLLESERDLAPEPIKEVMKVAAAKHAIDNGDFERAGRLLDDVSTEPQTDNPLVEVSGIAASNLEAARALLERAQSRRQG